MGSGEPLDPAFPLIKRAAHEQGVRAWAVGGFVRDRLLGRAHPDLDILVEDGDALRLAERFAELAGAHKPVLFPRFGTAQVTWGDRLVEFATARAESYATDSRKPEVRPATLREDLERRDFTVNTLLMDLDGHVHDPLGRGLADLEARLLRTPRDPVETFSDDPLRMLRAIRFAAQLGFRLAPDLLPAMRKLKDRLRPPVLSVERTADELRKMLLSERPALALELMDEGGLLEIVLPELAATKGVAQKGWHHADVYGHTLEALALAPPALTERLAVLLHDTGKPLTAGGDGTFYGHEQKGAELAAEALRRLRFSNAEAERVSTLIRLHMRPVYYESSWGDSAVRRLARDAGDLLGPLLAVARADIAASDYPEPEKLDDLQARLMAVLEEEPSRIRVPVSGEDVMRELGLRPGPEVGRIKAEIEEKILEGELEPDREAILDHLRRRKRSRGEGGGSALRGRP
ncbi:MAG: HD domain-containing protein [Chloroflexi bacterium]|nr:MAG: HD domain-containing protein [Chloroflexota bacterium]